MLIGKYCLCIYGNEGIGWFSCGNTCKLVGQCDGFHMGSIRSLNARNMTYGLRKRLRMAYREFKKYISIFMSEKMKIEMKLNVYGAFIIISTMIERILS